MQAKIKISTLASFMYVFCLMAAAWAQAEVRTFPAPEGEAANDVYSVTVNGRPVDVYAAQCPLWEGDYYFASFEFSGKVEIQVRSKSSMESTKILPDRFGVRMTREDADTVTLEAERPFRISVEPTGRVRPLLIFGEEIEKDAPRPDDPNVVYFGPGVHKAGKISLTDGQTLYLAGGAVVKGCVHAVGKNITVRGRGILAGEDSPRFQGPGRYPIDFQNATGAVLRDIIVRNPWSWTTVFWNCDGVTIENLKICGARMINDDALDLVNTRNVVVRDCFFRTQDDCIAVKGMAEMTPACENIRVENCQFWTDVANIYRIGYECQTEAMRNIVSKNIDVLHYSKDCREPSHYWANTIFWLQPSANMPLSDCHFEDIVVYSDGSDMLMLMAKPMRCQYGKEKVQVTGTLKSCSFKNLQVVGECGNFTGLIYILGDSDTHSVDGLTFENVRYFGTSIDEKSSCVEIGKFSKNIRFLR